MEYVEGLCEDTIVAFTVEMSGLNHEGTSLRSSSKQPGLRDRKKLHRLMTYE
jgi:hypothetical protein